MKRDRKIQIGCILVIILLAIAAGILAKQFAPNNLFGKNQTTEVLQAFSDGTENVKTVENENLQNESLQTESLPTENTQNDTIENSNLETETLEQEQEESSISLVMVGDMLMHDKVVESGLQEDGSYQFDHLFTHVKDEIQQADLALVNQETIIGGKDIGLSGYPCFNSPFELADAEVDAGFDVILQATNHALDKGKKGILRDIEYWETTYPQIACLGIFDSKEDSENDIYYYEKDGIRIAILNYTYGTNGINPPSDMPYIVNYLKEDKVIRDLTEAQEQADFVVVCPHWGTEYNLGISAEQERWTQIFLENGVDLVIGTHPHVIEPIEWVNDESGNQMLVYYSLGNFVNGTESTKGNLTHRMVGGLAEVTIGRNENGEAVVTDYGVEPLVCHMSYGNEYTVYYLSEYTEELAKENRILQQYPEFSLEDCELVVDEVWE